ncbi:MAG: hypothetical protein U0V70_21390 [Terriglobia bacterium]
MNRHLRIVTILAFTGLFPTYLAGEAPRKTERLSPTIQNAANQQTSNSQKEVSSFYRQKLISGGGGYSYVCFIPYVTNSLTTRTNLGLNNFSTDSLVSGANPQASVLVQLYNVHGSVVGQANYLVNSNELLQIQNIIPTLGASINVGWLLIYSDEPLTAWESVIKNATNDPSIELAIADQPYKPTAYLAGVGTRLMIQSTTNTGSFQSSLTVVNVGFDDCSLLIKIYDAPGNLVGTETAVVPVNGMYVSNSVRGSSFGPIIIEATDPNPNNGVSPQIIANSLVTSTNQTGGFFPAFALPQAGTVSVAGIWDGTILSGTLISAQVTLTLYQEEDMLYGTLNINSGVFPTLFRNLPIAGQITNYYNFQNTDPLDQDNTFFVYRFIGSIQSGHLKGDTLYFDEKNRSAVGTLDLTRTGPVYVPSGN